MKKVTENTPEMKHLRNMQMLRIYWGEICKVYDAVAGDVGFEYGPLNSNYVLLTIRIDKILAKEEFAELRKEKPSIYDSFMGNLDDLHVAYELMRPELWSFYGKLERLWLEKADGLGMLKLKDDEQQLLDYTDRAIAAYRKERDHLYANFLKMSAGEQEEVTQEKKVNATAPPRKIELHQLQPNHYNYRTGILWLSATDKVVIASKGKVKRPDGKKYEECWLLERLFKTVNNLKRGVKISSVNGVHPDKVDKKMVNKVRNYIFEIDKKIVEAGGPKRLIFVQDKTVKIDSSYL